MKTYLTSKEIHVMGIQRTGQHAIIAWVIGHFDKVCFRNGMSSIADRGHRGVQPPFWYFTSEKEKLGKWIVSKEDKIESGQDAIILGTEFIRPAIGLCPIIEDQKKALAKKANVDEFSEKRYNVVVLRSPYNHFSSILSWHKCRALKRVVNFQKCWKVFAKEHLGITNTVKNKVLVKYDEWFTNEEYRKGLSYELGVPFSDAWINVVLKIGIGHKYGSSFDTMSYRDAAQKMDVTNRWKKYVDDPLFKEVFKDEELKELSKEIFGELPF